MTENLYLSTIVSDSFQSEF